MSGNFTAENLLCEKLNLVLEAVPCGIGILDENGYIVYVNSTYLAIVNQPIMRVESGWYSGRMRSESLEQKMIRKIKSGKALEKFI
ncbi:PAS domain-containing protein [Sporomusa malonica]|nr:PAS domain-containing protein [Sporomusa malonica]